MTQGDSVHDTQRADSSKIVELPIKPGRGNADAVLKRAPKPSAPSDRYDAAANVPEDLIVPIQYFGTLLRT
jgi:hypothetical protein